MNTIKLKSSQKICILRDRIGALDNNSRSEFVTTVIAALTDRDFDTCNGTMSVSAYLVDHVIPEYNKSSVYEKNGDVYAEVDEDWVTDMKYAAQG